LAAPGAAASSEPVGGLLGFVQEHFLEAKAALLEGVLPAISVGEGESRCEECTERVAKRIAEVAMAKMIATCKAGKGCRHACQQLDEDAKVVLGMLLVKHRPIELAEMFCAGKGACTKKEVMGGTVGFHKKAMLMYMEADKEDFDEVIEKAGEMASAAKPGAGHFLGGLMKAFHPTDRDCMHKHIEEVMEKVEGRMAKKCEVLGSQEKKCPILEKACEFKEANPEVFHGAMLAKVEPWKFAMGFCAPHKEAPHPVKAALDWARKAKGKAICHKKCGWNPECHKHCFKAAAERMELKPLPLLAV